ncbi:hypothetical protein ACE6H2_016408 [Prunus campanulata]
MFRCFSSTFSIKIKPILPQWNTVAPSKEIPEIAADFELFLVAVVVATYWPPKLFRQDFGKSGHHRPSAQVILPTVVMLLLIAIRMRVDTQIHPSQPYIRKGTFVEVGKGISPNFEQVLELLLNKEEFLAFAPDTEETRSMINIISVKFPLLKNVSRVYKDEQELETYIGSDLYGTCNQIM